MIFSYNWLKDYVQKLPKPEKLVELLTMHAFEVSDLKETKNQKPKTKNDWILDIDVLPNRGPDCFSHLGIAREIAAITISNFQFPISKLKEDKNIKTKDFVNVEIKDKRDCSRYTARVVTDVKVGPSPKWIQERLKVCGLRPINNIVDIANYVMLETGQPLHAFDFEKIKSIQNQKSKSKNKKYKSKIKNIIVRRAEKREKIVTLDNEEYKLDKDILIIADKDSPLAIAGIKGGKKAEIDKRTKAVVLESANFDSRVVRKGSKKLNLKTDASWRFEHGLDPNLTETAINRAAELIQEAAGGKIAYGLVDFYPPPFGTKRWGVYPKKALPKKVKLDLSYVERLLGVKIARKEIIKILKALDFRIIQYPISNIQYLIVEVPSFRLDISLAEDLIEEIGRIYSYQKIPAVFPVVSLIPPKRNLDIFWEDAAKNILKEAGFNEVYNYSFIGEKEAKTFSYQGRELVEIENPMSSEQRYLRPSLIPNLLNNVKENFKYFNLIKIFELGKIFRKIKNQKSKIKNTNQKSKITEKRMLAGLITGDAFYQLKGVVDSLLNKLGISNIWYDEYQQTPEESKLAIWEPKKSAEIKVDSEEIGFLGEISPKILKKMKIQGKVVLFDIDFEKLIKLCSEEHEYQPISQYPAAIRDLAVLVPADIKVVDVLNKINTVGGPLIRDIDLFDIYEGSEIPAGKKNLAFHIVYQAEDRTLKTKEIDKIQQKIIKVLEENPQWEVRK